ncbi:MAG: hypothetical protein M0031_04805 [Thermaerobacter sp.]|nr:hypothetical protein [Thermaerobacter sp.]
MSRARRLLVVGMAVALLAGGTAASFAAAPTGTGGSAPLKGRQEHIAALLAKDSGQSVSQVVYLKQQDRTWKAVVQALKIAPSTWRKQLRSLFLAPLHRAAMVEVLAKASGQTPAEIRSLKKGKTWAQVAQGLNLNLKALAPQIHQAFRAKLAAVGRRSFLIRFLAKRSGKTVAQIKALLKQEKNLPAVAQSLGITKQELGKALAAHRGALLRRSVSTGAVVAVLAKASGKTPAQVRALKAKGIKWSQVASDLGLNWNTLQAKVRAAVHARLTARSRNEAVASFLAKLSGKTLSQVQALKTKGQTWVDVAHSLGIQ